VRGFGAQQVSVAEGSDLFQPAAGSIGLPGRCPAMTQFFLMSIKTSLAGGTRESMLADPTSGVA
jgi:hypothetical protein